MHGVHYLTAYVEVHESDHFILLCIAGLETIIMKRTLHQSAGGIPNEQRRCHAEVRVERFSLRMGMYVASRGA